MRGQIVADSLANSISRAIGFGINLIDLSGVDQVFANRIADNRYIAEIILDDLESKAQVPGLGPVRKGTSASALVMNGSQAVGRVTVYLRDPSLIETASAPISAAILIMLVVTITAWEGLNYAIRRGPQLREAAATKLLLQLTELDFKSVIRVSRPNRLDIRWVWLTTQIRDMNERFTRIFRLVESLRQTEPSITKQMMLLELAKQARGHAKFASGKPSAIKLSPVAVDVRWLSFIATTALSVNLFVSNKGSVEGSYSNPLTLGICLFVILLGYGLVQQCIRARSAQEICIAGLVVLGGAPLLSFAISAGEAIGMMTAGQVNQVKSTETKFIGNVALVCLQALGLGIFFAGLRRFAVSSATAARDWERLPVVVLSALLLMGASLTWIWEEIFGSHGMKLLSFGLVIITYFFYAISRLEQRTASLGNDRLHLTPIECFTTAAVVGFVLGTVAATVFSGIFPAGQIDNPLFFCWPLIAIGVGFFIPLKLFRLKPYVVLVFILSTQIIVLASIGLELKAGVVASTIALMLMTSPLIGLLSKTGENLSGSALTAALGVISSGMAAGLIVYAACIYLGYPVAMPWAVAAFGTLILLVTQGKTFAKTRHVA